MTKSGMMAEEITPERALQNNIKNIKENSQISKGIVVVYSCEKCDKSRIKHFGDWIIISGEEVRIIKEKINGRLFVKNHVCDVCALLS